MTVSVKAPTSTTGSIQLNGSDVLTIDSSGNLTAPNNLTVTGTVTQTGAATFSGGITGNVNFDSGTLYVDATNNNVGIGTTAPSTGYGGTISNVKLALKGSGAGGNNGTATLLMGGDNNHYSYLSSEHTGGGSTYLAFGTASGATNPSERMRIDSGGKILMGHTSPLSSGKVQTYANSGYAHQMFYDYSSGTGYFVEFLRTTGTFGSVAAVVGTISASTTTTTYATSSDYRLKNNVAPMSGSIDRLKQLKPSTWSWVQDGSHGEGFLAHEAQAVVPESVTGTKDEVDDEGNPVYQGIDQSKLVPLLTSALQEAITKIEDLVTRIQALESA